MYIETHTRAILKTVSWRIFATFLTGLIVYFFIGRIDIAAMVGGIEMISKLIMYYLHERIWNNIKIGKEQLKPFVIWFTGLSGSGKSTLAMMIYNYLNNKGYKVEYLDGDNVRKIFPNTGFTKDKRNTHIKRIGYLASKIEKNGIFVVASFVSPYKESRDFVRNLCNNYVEVFVNTSVEECERRDTKGLYKKARNGEIDNLTGINDPYEIPDNPEIVIITDNESPEESFKKILKYINYNKSYIDN